MSNIADAFPGRTCYTDSMKECTGSLVGHTDLQGFSYAPKEVSRVPRKPLQPCAYPGCPRLCEGRYCEKHRKMEAKRYETYSRDNATYGGTSVRRKYGRAWKRIRDSYTKEYPFCEQCFERGILVPVDEVHHKVPVSKGGTHERSNLMSLCRSCHNKIHAELGDRNARN